MVIQHREPGAQVASPRPNGTVIADDAEPLLGRLAAECATSSQLVETLYRREVGHLQREARITAYIPVLALRRVRETLRRRPQGGATPDV